MSRRTDLDHFYEMLEAIKEREEGYRRLRECTGRTGWPERGLYFSSRKEKLGRMTIRYAWCEWGPML